MWWNSVSFAISFSSLLFVSTFSRGTWVRKPGLSHLMILTSLLVITGSPHFWNKWWPLHRYLLTIWWRIDIQFSRASQGFHYRLRHTTTSDSTLPVSMASALHISFLRLLCTLFGQPFARMPNMILVLNMRIFTFHFRTAGCVPIGCKTSDWNIFTQKRIHFLFHPSSCIALDDVTSATCTKLNSIILSEPSSIMV